jgi:hypothetical protein
VSAFARDLDNTTLWYENIEAVDWRSATPAAVGARIEFTARLLGRRLTYTYEILELARSPASDGRLQAGRSPWRRPTPARTRRGAPPR